MSNNSARISFAVSNFKFHLGGIKKLSKKEAQEKTKKMKGEAIGIGRD